MSLKNFVPNKVVTGLVLLVMLALGIVQGSRQVHAQTPPQLPIVVGEKATPLAVTVDPASLATSSSGTAPLEGVGEPLVSPPLLARQRPDSVAQLKGSGSAEAIDLLSEPDENFPGITSTAISDSGGPLPDTVGDVGPSHFVQMVNATQFQVWDKQGASLLGPVDFGALWPAGSRCRNNRGDPIVVFDHLADRWLLSQFARPNHMCIAISQTPNPADGTWFLYEFDTTVFPDYPKFGVWPDGYYMSSYESPNLGVYVFDRAQMLNGAAAGFVKSTLPDLGAPGVRDTRILPADLDGAAPPEGTPNYFVRPVDDQQDRDNPTDRLEVYTFDVDWLTSTFSFSLVDTLIPAAFDTMLCNRNGQGIRDCIPQPDADDTIDALSNRPMMQLKYRNFGAYAAMVFNQTIDVSGSIPNVLPFTPANEVAGIRWYELRRSGANWSIYQQGTYAPQPINAANEAELLHRWMGSMAMDKAGNIAIGYNIVNGDSDNNQEVYPGIRYTGRSASDPLGIMQQGEKTILDGTVAQGNLDGNIVPQRWGDYSALSVDPTDDCTFWYTTHVANGVTRIASFRFLTCNSVDVTVSKIDSPNPVNAGDLLTYTITAVNYGASVATNVMVTDTLPAEVTYIADTGGCNNLAETLTCAIGNLAAGASRTFSIQVRVSASLIADGINAISNTVVISAAEQDANTSNNSTTATTAVVESANLRVTKDCKPDRPQTLVPGAEANCAITIENLGPSGARAVTLNDAVISNGVFNFGVTDPASCTPGGANPQNGSGLVTCVLGNLAAGASIVVRVPVSATEPQDINDRATVTSASPDPDMANNEATDGLTVAAAADLALTKFASADRIAPGLPLTYTLVVTNNGPSTATGVVLSDTVPDVLSVTSVTVTSGPGTCLPPQGEPAVITCSLGTLPSGATAVVTIVATAQAEATITNFAKVDAKEADLNPTNNAVAASTLVRYYYGYLPAIYRDSTPPPANLIVAQMKIEPVTGIRADSVTTLTLTVKNVGPGATASEFWVDLYVNPVRPPEKPLDIWNLICKKDPADTCPDDLGIAWLVTRTLLPGETITLSSASSDPNLAPEQTRWSGKFRTLGIQTLWAYVDPWGAPGVAWAAVAETNEQDNILGPVYVYAGEGAVAAATTAAVEEIPARPWPKLLKDSKPGQANASQ